MKLFSNTKNNIFKNLNLKTNGNENNNRLDSTFDFTLDNRNSISNQNIHEISNTQLLDINNSGYNLSFSIDNIYPDKIIYSDQQKHRVLGKSKNKTIYSIFAINLTNNDIKIAEKIKKMAIDYIIKNNSDIARTPSLIYETYELCLKLLNQFQTNENKDLIAYLVAHDIIGYGPISIFLEDSSNIEEIEIYKPTSNIIIYHSIYGRCITNLKFNSEEAFRFTINRLIENTNKELDYNNPIIDAQLNDGSRIHAQLAPYSISGGIASIRLNSGNAYNIKKYIQNKPTLSKIFAYLWMALEIRQNIIIAGAPATGKTTFLRSLYPLMPRFQKIVTIEEDINELKTNSNFINIVSLQSSTKKGDVKTIDQVINALHLRPDRLVIGEIRGSETKELFSGANFGIPFMTTMHANSNGIELLNRLQSAPMLVDKYTINMLDISIFLRQNAKGERYIDDLVEYKWYCRNEFELNNNQENEDNNPENKEFKIIHIVENGIFLNSSLTKSKMMQNYSKSNLLNINNTLIEFGKRTRFLNLLNSSKAAKYSVEEYIDTYKWFNG
ncbi:MAG: ATPase, T2SS/T4P/T4SS family [Candidatus Micrarchaeia archaeon]